MTGRSGTVPGYSLGFDSHVSEDLIVLAITPVKDGVYEAGRSSFISLFACSSFGPERKRPLGRGCPQRAASSVARLNPASLPPRCSRRETPINQATRYLGGSRCVKAILGLSTAGPWRSIPRSMTWWRTPVEDPGRSAGPKVPDEERKGIQPGTAGYGERERFTRLMRFQRLRRRPPRRVQSGRSDE